MEENYLIIEELEKQGKLTDSDRTVLAGCNIIRWYGKGKILALDVSDVKYDFKWILRWVCCVLMFCGPVCIDVISRTKFESSCMNDELRSLIDSSGIKINWLRKNVDFLDFIVNRKLVHNRGVFRSHNSASFTTSSDIQIVFDIQHCDINFVQRLHPESTKIFVGHLIGNWYDHCFRNADIKLSDNFFRGHGSNRIDSPIQIQGKILPKHRKYWFFRDVFSTSRILALWLPKELVISILAMIWPEYSFKELINIYQLSLPRA